MQHEIDVLPAYLISARNLSADGSTRWEDAEISIWLHQERMQQASVPLEWLRDFDMRNQFPDDLVMSTFASIFPLVEFFNVTCNRVCAWRPGRYTASAVLNA